MTMDNEALRQALKEGGFYGTNDTWNSLIKLPGDKHIYRHRVETIVIRNKKEVFLKIKPNGEYFLPGGSTEKDRTKEEQAIRECEEEAHVKIKNIKDSGISYKKIMEPKPWVKEQPIVWDGCYTEIFCAEYNGNYKGKIKKVDEDSFIRSGEWYPLKKVFKILHKEHMKALQWYLKKIMNKHEDIEITEGYGLNYIKNRIFLRQLSRNENGEINLEDLRYIIKNMTKYYNENKNSSKIKRLAKKDEEKFKNLFFIRFQLTPTNFEPIYIAVSFYDDKTGNPGSATFLKMDGNMIVPAVILHPVFFTYKDINMQVYIFLHEIGHIRLQHLLSKNDPAKSIFTGFADYNNHRIDYLQRGKVIYEELLADTYAMLNGASLYSILGLATMKDFDENYIYVNSNNEIAIRYNRLMKEFYRYNKNYDMYKQWKSLQNKKKVPKRILHESYIHLDKEDIDSIMMEKYNDCPIDEFGIPETRSFPLNTKKRVRSAIHLFGHAPDKYKPELAKRILKAMKKYDISISVIGEKAQLRKYI